MYLLINSKAKTKYRKSNLKTKVIRFGFHSCSQSVDRETISFFLQFAGFDPVRLIGPPLSNACSDGLQSSIRPCRLVLPF